jgi:hypothetical protein
MILGVTGKDTSILLLTTGILTFWAYISIGPFWKSSLNDSIAYILRKYGWEEGDVWETVSDEFIEQFKYDPVTPYVPASS